MSTAYPRYLLEARLLGLELSAKPLIEAGLAFGLRLSLVLPRPNVADREVVRVVRNPEKLAEIRLTDDPLVESMLFKQSIHGPTGFRVQLSPITESSVLEQVFSTMLRAGFIATGAWMGADQPVAVRGLAREPLRFLGDFATSGSLPEVLATGFLNLEEAPKGAKKSPKEFRLPLHALADWRRRTPQHTRQRAGAASSNRARRLIARGEAVGELILSLRVI